jgi:glycosyltransferase involved in cell wall biosynthesis
MRILHVMRSVDPVGGGVAEVVTRLGLEEVRTGQSVRVATLDDPDAPWLARFPLPIDGLGPVATTYGYTSRFGPWLGQHLHSFDVICVHGLWQYPGFAVWRAARKSGTPYLVFPHGMLDPWFKRRYPLKHAKKYLYWPWAEYRVLRDAAAVLFTAEDERLLARQSFWPYCCREKVVTLGTAAPPEALSTDRRLFAQSYPETAGRRVVLFLGRIHEKKGCDLLIRALASATHALPAGAPWHLVLAGPVATDAYRRKLDALIGEVGLAGRVTWTGMIGGDLKWSAFRSADVFALPSHQENFGVAVAEALGCSVPVLVSDKVNIWREVVADAAGFADADTAAGTGRLLARWMSLDDAAKSRMQANAARCFARRFDIRTAAARLTSTIEDVLP